MLKGANNIGNNPTFDDGALSVETHLLDFDGDIYGQDIRLHFVERLRGEQRFDSPEALKAQIGLDIERAIAVLEPWVRSGNGGEK